MNSSFILHLKTTEIVAQFRRQITALLAKQGYISRAQVLVLADFVPSDDDFYKGWYEIHKEWWDQPFENTRNFVFPPYQYNGVYKGAKNGV